MRTRSLALLLPIMVLSLLAFSSCPGTVSGRTNIVLVTIESLRADRLAGPPLSPDPFPNLRALAGAGGIKPMMASSSDTLPSLASLMTGSAPGRHGALVEGIDRLQQSPPTLAALLSAAGYRTAGFPSLGSLGLASGLSRGFNAYGWPPSDRITDAPLVATDSASWVGGGARRPGQATVADALRWVRKNRDEPMFLWIHLAEASPPYASERDLIAAFGGSTYDAALAYEDRRIKEIVDGFISLGLKESTVFIVAGNHGESLGAHGETFHGQNLYPPSLETAAAIVMPERLRSARTDRSSNGETCRLIDLFVLILDLAGLDPPEGTEAARGLPAISREHPLHAVTLRPRSAFGWDGRIALYDGEWVWFGPKGEELYRARGDLQGAENEASDHPEVANLLRERAMEEISSHASRLGGRPVSPSKEERARLMGLLRSAAGARETGQQERELAALQQAWELDPGNFEVAKWLAIVHGPRGREEIGRLRREVEARGSGLPEASLAVAGMLEVIPSGVAAAAQAAACEGGGDACRILLALRTARDGKPEEAAAELAPVAERAGDPDVWRLLGELYLSVENTYRAGQAFEKALSLRPNDPDILIRQGDALAATRDLSGAEAKYVAARAVWPGLPIVELRLGRLARQKGDRTAAVEHFRKGLDVDTNTVAGTLAFARLLAQEGMTQEAIPRFLDAAARDPGSVDGLYGAAEALAAEGRLDEAESRLREALDRDPSSDIVLYQLARLVVYKGDREEGGRLLEKLAQHATPALALKALDDPLFTNDAPEAPLAKGMKDLYEVVRRATPEGGVHIVHEPPAQSGP